MMAGTHSDGTIACSHSEVTHMSTNNVHSTKTGSVKGTAKTHTHAHAHSHTHIVQHAQQTYVYERQDTTQGGVKGKRGGGDCRGHRTWSSARARRSMKLMLEAASLRCASSLLADARPFTCSHQHVCDRTHTQTHTHSGGGTGTPTHTVTQG